MEPQNQQTLSKFGKLNSFPCKSIFEKFQFLLRNLKKINISGYFAPKHKFTKKFCGTQVYKFRRVVYLFSEIRIRPNIWYWLKIGWNFWMTISLCLICILVIIHLMMTDWALQFHNGTSGWARGITMKADARFWISCQK